MKTETIKYIMIGFIILFVLSLFALLYVNNQKDYVVIPELEKRLKYCEKEKVYFEKQGKNYPEFSEYIWNCNDLSECKVVYIDCKYILQTYNLQNLTKKIMPISYNQWKSELGYTYQINELGVIDVSNATI